MPPEVTLLSHIRYEPLALVVIIYIVFRKPIEQFFNFIWFKITNKKSISLEQYIENDAEDRRKRQKEFDDRFEKIQSEVNHAGINVINLREEIQMLTVLFENYEHTADTMNKVNLENTLFNEALSPFRRLKAYLYLITIGANGRIKMKGTELILEYKETWLDVQDTTSEHLKFEKPEDKEYFDTTMSEINRMIFDIRSKPYAEHLKK
jgi:hypothetical protein